MRRLVAQKLDSKSLFERTGKDETSASWGEREFNCFCIFANHGSACGLGTAAKYRNPMRDIEYLSTAIDWVACGDCLRLRLMS